MASGRTIDRLPMLRWLVRAGSILACIGLWQLASSLHVHLGIVTFRNVPPPTEVAQSAIVLLKSPKLLAHVSSSLWRVFAGYGAAVLIGIAFGFAIGRSRAASDQLLPPLELLRPIPAVAWIPLSILMFPSSELSMIFITFICAPFPTTLYTLHDVANASISLGEGTDAFEAVRGLNFAVAPGELVCVLGPSGCGKSTLLGALAGHLQLTQGQLTVDGQPLLGPNPDPGIVFQQHTLFPWKRVRDNVAFGPKMRGVGKAERRRTADEILKLVGLDGFETFYPSQLSGGMQQRVEIARVLINQPRVLLMDEPFGALDAQTRSLMQEVLLDIWTKIPTTTVFVTHDIEEALFLADRIIVMSARPGKVIDDIRLPFARPRHGELVTETEFVRLKRHILNLLRRPDNVPPLARWSPLGVPG